MEPDAGESTVDDQLGQQLMTAGPVSFRAESALRTGAIERRLHLDAHADAGPFDGRDEIGGIVDRVQLVPIRYVEQGDRYFVPAEQMEAIEVESTAARQNELPSSDDGHTDVELLVWLRVGDQPG